MSSTIRDPTISYCVVHAVCVYSPDVCEGAGVSVGVGVMVVAGTAGGAIFNAEH